MYTILGATGNIGSVISKALLKKGEKVRVVGRSAGRLQPFVQRGAEAFVGNVADAQAMTQALTGARAAFLMIPPSITSPDYRADQEKTSDAFSAAVKSVGLQYAVNLSSYGAQAPAGTGPIAGLHNSEQKLNAIDRLNVLHLRAGYFFENHLAGLQMIQMMEIFGTALRGDLKIPMIATRDIGAYAAERLLKLDFNGKRTQELQGERDLTFIEVVAVIAKELRKPDLRYVQIPYDQVEKVLEQMGAPPKTVASFIELFQGINNGIVTAMEPRSAANSTPTSIETFVKEVFAPAYRGKSVGA
ncbi:MAG TPA: NAD(P)H-binding protein [Candidatus Acidoferrum sp.]|nr:NAD(P)H-binding protein [Candidatus Acidoferrum sp.]